MDGDGPKKQLTSVDLCRLSPFERQKVKDAWLSVPKQYRPAPYADSYSLVRKTPFGLSVPALKAKCSPHIELLATAKDPLPHIHYVTKAEREIQKELEEEMTKEELRWLRRKPIVLAPSGVSKAALSGKTTPRIDAMAIPNLGRPIESFGDTKQLKKRKRSLPSHFPLPEKPRFKKKKIRVCGCAESIKRKFFAAQEIEETQK